MAEHQLDRRQRHVALHQLNRPDLANGLGAAQLPGKAAVFGIGGMAGMYLGRGTVSEISAGQDHQMDAGLHHCLYGNEISC